jgi:TRAP-type mannitol/chloroaromatic compound transport system substrate-binding protein
MKTGKAETSELRKENVKRREFLKASVAGAAGLAIAGMPKAAFSQQKSKVYKWRLQSIYAPGEPTFSYTLTNFVNRVKKMSGGQIDIELFAGGALIPSKDIIASVGKNIVEMGASAASYSSGLIPVVYTTLVPMGPRSAEECAMIWHQGWGDILRAAYDKLNVKLLTMQIVTDIPLYSTKPIRKIEEIKGMKIRTHGSTALFVEQLGASTVFIPGEEVYMALSTKTIDAATWGGFSNTYPRKWFEVAKYVIQPSLVPMFQQNELAINKGLFNSLPAELQSILQTAADLAMWDCRMGEALNNDEAWLKMKAAGNEIITLPPESVAKMTEAAKIVWDNLASRSQDSYQAMKIISDFLRAKGYTDYVIETRSITVKK